MSTHRSHALSTEPISRRPDGMDNIGRTRRARNGARARMSLARQGTNSPHLRPSIPTLLDPSAADAHPPTLVAPTICVIRHGWWRPLGKNSEDRQWARRHESLGTYQTRSRTRCTWIAARRGRTRRRWTAKEGKRTSEVRTGNKSLAPILFSLSRRHHNSARHRTRRVRLALHAEPSSMTRLPWALASSRTTTSRTRSITPHCEQLDAA
ncbi:hypothetical protein BJ912DRAFT_175804 [Pholiota molesta]|nr:hypothetical protein BJ912DRAFT_175804 [Pholiota molesta]